ncbi:peptide chain release factor N(5)-glutamine methyltransferase [Buchnera aphidicola (Neophyllaphis podocarpi)]|uniref:peptide chain release factor N(5)-glutamine methyltransferase n=1 Tax=Buchnera aphidicola TaxID=9 RepID=UPI0031B7F6EC
MKINKFIKYIINKFNILISRLDIELILTLVLRKSRTWIVAFDDIKLSDIQIKILNYFIFRRCLGEPIAYLLNKKEFWSLNFIVSKDVLIPRPETEIIVEKAISIIKKSYKNYMVLDLGTGCGAIALSIAKERNNCFVLGIDISEKSIIISRKNAIKLNIKNANFVVSNWFSKIKDNVFNLIVSNPPYIDIYERKLICGDLLFEPLTALVSYNKGLLAIENIISQSRRYLFNNGWLIIEHGWNQKIAVQKLFQKYEFKNIKTYKDYSKLNRVTVGKK